jgi:hypothetical protein
MARSPVQAAGSSVTGSLLPQAPIQCRQRPTHGLRLCNLVILSRQHRSPVTDRFGGGPALDGGLIGLAHAPSNHRGRLRHATSCQRNSLHAKTSRAEPGVPRALHAATHPPAPTGLPSALETGPVSKFGPSRGRHGQFGRRGKQWRSFCGPRRASRRRDHVRRCMGGCRRCHQRRASSGLGSAAIKLS